MSNQAFDLDSDEGETPTRPGQLSANAHWMFGSVFALIVLSGFAFGVWVGAAKPKTEVAENKQKEDSDKPGDKPADKPKPPAPQPQPQPQPEPKNKEPEPKPKDNEPKAKEPEPKAKEPEPKPKETEPKGKEPDPKKVDVKPVAFKEVRPLFISYCGNCHGQQVGKPKGNIDLRTVAAIFKGGDNGDIIKAGEPLKSKLYTSMLPDASEKMPPDNKPGPNPKEMQLIHDWILNGAKERRRPVRVRRGVRAATRREVALTHEPGGG